MKMCYNCNVKRREVDMAYAVENVATFEHVAFFCSEKCLREKLPYAKIEEKEPQP